MNQSENQYSSWTPEQKFYALCSEMLTQLDIITGYTAIAKKNLDHNDAENEELLNCINRIEESALCLKKLRDDLVQS